MYEPKQKVQEPFQAFKQFKPYTEVEANNMLDMITKANKNEYYMKNINEMIGKRAKYGYMAATRSSPAQNKTQSLPKLVTANKIQVEEDQEEMNILEKVLDQHQKKYDP